MLALTKWASTEARAQLRLPLESSHPKEKHVSRRHEVTARWNNGVSRGRPQFGHPIALPVSTANVQRTDYSRLRPTSTVCCSFFYATFSTVMRISLSPQVHRALRVSRSHSRMMCGVQSSLHSAAIKPSTTLMAVPHSRQICIV
jgi:hypothetical protein